MRRAPEFVTFTGFDDWTSIDGMRELSARYPIEWGVLFSPKRQGIDPRYPGGDAQSRIMWCDDLRKAGHLCGAHSDAIMDGRSISTSVPVDLSYFNRVQVNHADPKPMRVVEFAKGWEANCIVQTRSAEFPAYNRSVDWLFDASGGRGIAPPAWPRHPGGSRLVGYAGGLGPDNVRAAMEAIDAEGPYWLDMESGVRTDDRFDLEKCRAVCEAIWPGRRT